MNHLMQLIGFGGEREHTKRLEMNSLPMGIIRNYKRTQSHMINTPSKIHVELPHCGTHKSLDFEECDLELKLKGSCDNERF